MGKKQETENVLAFLQGQLDDAKVKYGEDSKQVIFVNCAIAGIKASKNDGFDIEIGHFSYEFCPDQYVGKVCLKKEQWDRKPIFNDAGTLSIPGNSIGVVIFVLESPHKYEFDKKTHAPIGPAEGKTGSSLAEMSRVLDFYPYRNYELILMNVIPFQCSLGVNPEKFRDEVFAEVWDEKNQKIKIGESFFEKRLRSLLKALNEKNVVIVNACTAGRERQKKVQKNIERVTGDNVKVTLLQTSHPSSWSIPELNKISES